MIQRIIISLVIPIVTIITTDDWKNLLFNLINDKFLWFIKFGEIVSAREHQENKYKDHSQEFYHFIFPHL